MKKFFGVLLSTMLLISSVGCGNSTTDSANNNDNETVTFVLDWTPNTNHTGVYVAKELGYYDEVGIDLDIVAPPEDGATSLVALGKANFGIDFQDSLAPAFALSEPLPVTAVATIMQHNTSGIISLKETDINSPKDLEGKTYATWDLPVEQAMIKTIMENDNGDFNKLELVPSTVTDVISALITNIDAVWVYYGWDGIATEVRDLETNFLQFSDYEDAFDYYTPVIIANNDFLKENEELSKKFLEATQKGYEYAIENPEEAGKILVKLNPGLEADLVIESQKYVSKQYKDDGVNWGYINPDRWNKFYNWLNDNNLVENPIPENTGFSNDFLMVK